MHRQSNSGNVRVGVLSHHNSKETKAILNAVADFGHEPVWIRRENFHSWIDETGVHVEPEVDVLANRLLLTKRDDPYQALQLVSLYEAQCPVLNESGAVRGAIDKYRAAALLSQEDVPVPPAHLATSQSAHEQWTAHISDVGVQKPTVGTNGSQMEKVESGAPAAVTIEGKQAFIQEYVDTTNGRASDVRVYVVGDEIVGAMRRKAQKGEWRANVALGADVEDVTETLGQEPRETARRAVAALELDYAGVDLVTDGEQWYVLEVNATAGFKGLFEATDRSVAPEIARYAIQAAGGTVAAEQCSRLATTLDDSVPECKPDVDSQASEKTTLGYTNNVQVSGTDSTEMVVAKADSGAKRTSIDAELAGRLGLGPITGTTTVRSGTATQSETRPLVDLQCKVGGQWQTTTASITDRSGMQYPMILGRDILSAYQLDIEQRVEEE